jgi:hypothetical protein
MDTALAPGYVKVTYSGTLFPHHITIPVNYDGTPVQGADPTLLTKDGSSIAGMTGVLGFLDLMKVFFHTTTTFGLVEFHTVDSTTGLDSFIFADDAGLTGTQSTANKPVVGAILTMKLTNGYLYRLYIMEGIDPANAKLLPPFGAGATKDISDYLISSDSIVYGRHNAYPFTPVSYLTKTNDKLRKQQGLA